MFDIGFSELLVVGVVALIVIGPERLPRVARTAGHMLGRLQRYVGTVKSEISREMELDELKKTGQQFKQHLEQTEHKLNDEVLDAQHAVRAIVQPESAPPPEVGIGIQAASEHETYPAESPQAELALEPAASVPARNATAPNKPPA